jgi:hypothetical protein
MGIDEKVDAFKKFVLDERSAERKRIEASVEPREVKTRGLNALSGPGPGESQQSRALDIAKRLLGKEWQKDEASGTLTLSIEGAIGSGIAKALRQILAAEQFASGERTSFLPGSASEVVAVSYDRAHDKTVLTVATEATHHMHALQAELKAQQSQQAL